jgi:hypothetical protein
MPEDDKKIIDVPEAHIEGKAETVHYGRISMEVQTGNLTRWFWFKMIWYSLLRCLGFKPEGFFYWVMGYSMAINEGGYSSGLWYKPPAEDKQWKRVDIVHKFEDDSTKTYINGAEKTA